MIRKSPQSPSKSVKLGESQKWYAGKGTTFFFNPQTISTFNSIYIGIFESKTIIRGFGLYDCTVRTKNCFNPRTHIGCDLRPFIFFGQLLQFQSTHPHRVRRWDCKSNYWGNKFQSTHPHRVRPHTAHVLSVRLLFQSTHPHRVRLRFGRWYDTLHTVSIHAPT